ncbi:MAG: L,D-transpeptidase family protein [Clostridia bacterium]|nr:L,D-transpeptidase family protein [Clostridia bacterium]
MKKRIFCIVLIAALMLALPVNALAAKKASIKFPVKMGLMLEDASVTLSPKLKHVRGDALTWESSDETVAQIWGGKLTALKAGKTVVTATGGGAKASCGVVVLPKAVSVGVGERFSLPRGGVEQYAVKDKEIAAISKKGVVTGVAAGETQLLVRYGKQKLVLDVTVTDGADAGDDPLPGVGDATQAVLVEYTGNSRATLTLHEKKNGVWQRLYECAAYVGENGIGKTRVGDKKTPAGVYNLTTPFGIKADPGAAMGYTQVTKYHYWCGDSSSKYYNQLVDERSADRKHTASDEYLINYKGVYNYCMFIDYNAAGEPGKGSCIFLHCAGSKKSTSGCVAIPETAMAKLIQWARPGVKIIIRN